LACNARIFTKLTVEQGHLLNLSVHIFIKIRHEIWKIVGGETHLCLSIKKNCNWADFQETRAPSVTSLF